MYRQPFAPPPAQSPPLHHPVPQHVSTVPMMRSPPPPMPQQPQMSGYGNPYQPSPMQGGNGAYPPGFGGFINDPTAQMGYQVGKTAMAAGQEYMEQNVSCAEEMDRSRHGWKLMLTPILESSSIATFLSPPLNTTLTYPTPMSLINSFS